MKKIAFILIFLASNGFAQDEIVTDRPDATESALTIPFKSIQLETGTTFSSEKNASTYSSPEYLIRVGLHRFLEFRVESSLYKMENIEGVNSSDLFLGVKAQLLKKEKFNIAFLSHVNLPENNRKNLSYVEKLLLSYEINETTELGVNIGIDGLGGSGQFVYAVALGTGITDRFGFFIENFGSISQDDGLTSVIDGGFSYLLKDKIQLDTKFGIDTQIFKDYFFGVGVSIRLFN